MRIVDIDGTIADDAWRRGLIRHDCEDLDEKYDFYYQASVFDKPINEDIIRDWDGQLTIVTARPEKFRKLTKEWLRDVFGLGEKDYALYMRPEGNVKSSPEYKEQCYRMIRSSAGINFDRELVEVYEDRQDVINHNVNLFQEWNFIKVPAPSAPQTEETGPKPHAGKATGGEILRSMAETFDDRSRTYGANFEMVPGMVKILFPNGVPPELVTDPRWHLFEIMLNKIARFSHTNLTDQDSIHDAAVYAAIIESLLPEEEQ